MAHSQSTDLLADACAASIVLVNQAHSTFNAVVKPTNTKELCTGNRKLVFPTPTLGSKLDDYCANVHYATVYTLETEGRGISYQDCLYVPTQVMNQQLIADINILHWLQSYEE